jgi:O6-methylguanine-DNA--protein-cysteine methyltransferase
MLSLVTALLLTAAAQEAKPAPAPAKTETKAEAKAAQPEAKEKAKAAPPEAKTETKAEAKAAQPEANKDAIPPRPAPIVTEHKHGHEEEPLSEHDQKVVKLAESLEAISRGNIAAYEDLIKLVREPKDCAATAKAVAAAAKKHETASAERKTASETMRKGFSLDDQRSAAGKALFAINKEIREFRKKLPEYENAQLAFSGKCPKQGDEVTKVFTSLRKTLVP